ncbi:MAG: malto-oligosyltrehalose trehalohydrolase [Hyphomicrobiaceae bacterium]|nr:malto-oligosyltrehalose trehalohydrolase [Methyloceanibacter sp.]MDX2318661.1 malto-oligosyltrehalose trehalohydrolase [Hyphomicrobiaceae bacterium]MDX2450697.1 malto-oligosyltrehalose trehalohydrolase [Hyphomicrobiaceae bacterium]
MTARFAHSLPWGTELIDGGARFKLWAPAQNKVSVLSENGARIPMTKTTDGWFEVTTDAVSPGDGYHFVLADGARVPDPASRAQMSDVHGMSQLVDPLSYEWQTPDWKGRPWEEAVIYELHAGTFSPEGSFDGVTRDLDRLVDMGVTAIEIMPVAQFGGDRGWGYDGVLLYAPHTAYGGPVGLKHLVDAAHERDLMIVLDVVYNHFGPDGNYLHLYAPDFFDPKRRTPWGAAIAFERKPVREFFFHNMLYWLEEFRFDGLRFDAIDHIRDASDEPLLIKMAREVRARFPDRHIHLTIEDEDNSTRLLKYDHDNRPRLFTAAWNDDWHHAMHALLTGENAGYYQDYADAPTKRIAETMVLGFGYQGEPSPYHGGRKRGESSAHLPPIAFVDFLQNHDQVGNRARGDRLTHLAPAPAVEVALTLLMLSPHIPLLFMGEEYGEKNPFYFFTDFTGDLAEAVRKGRNNEFRNNQAFAEAGAEDLIPDPNALSTFTASKLAPKTTERAQFVKRLIAARFEHIVPRLTRIGGDAGTVEALEGNAFAVSWKLADGAKLMLIANFADTQATLPLKEVGVPFFTYPDASLAQDNLPPWSVVVSISGQE